MKPTERVVPGWSHDRRVAALAAMLLMLLAACGSLADRAAKTVPTPAPPASRSVQPVSAKTPPPASVRANHPLRRLADFNGDGYRDLAVGKWGTFGTAGLVQVVYGSAAGLTAEASQQWSPTDFGITSEQFGDSLANGDFDADGFSDLAIGAPALSSEGARAGQVLVLYGSPNGLRSERSQVWAQSTPAIAGRSEPNDFFGAALTSGDFGRGLQDDLAIGVPGENRSGAVHVLFGDSSGLTAANSELWRLSSPGVSGRPRTGDTFGQALVAGDFDGGYDELVVGVPGRHGGAVVVLRGSAAGLTTERAQRWQSGTGGVKGPRSDSGFGSALAVGRFDGGDELDLAVGDPTRAVGGDSSKGAVHVLYGTTRGLTANGDQLWTERVLGTDECACNPEDQQPRFGATLLAADLGRGAAEDLVVGAPEKITEGFDAGAVSVIYGTAAGLRKAHSQQFSHDTRGVRGSDPDGGAQFGSALALAGPFAGARYPTLVVGSPYYNPDSDGFEGPGLVNLMRGSGDGLTVVGDQVLRASDFPQRPVGGNFGRSLTG